MMPTGRGTTWFVFHHGDLAHAIAGHEANVPSEVREIDCYRTQPL
jgi:hypothetical protein